MFHLAPTPQSLLTNKRNKAKRDSCMTWFEDSLVVLRLRRIHNIHGPQATEISTNLIFCSYPLGLGN